jgi:hypothetical protein
VKGPKGAVPARVKDNNDGWIILFECDFDLFYEMFLFSGTYTVDYTPTGNILRLFFFFLWKV